MDKGKLLNFINKYSLNGLCNTVKWTAKSRGLITDFITEDKNILGKVAVKGVNFPDGQFGVYNTKALVKILGILQNEIDLEVEDSALSLKDESVSAKFLLASLDIINDPPAATPPEFDFDFDINSVFIDKFLKARSALDEATIFAFTMEDDKPVIVLNYAEHNTDRIIIPLPNVDHNIGSPLLFNIDNFKEILAANKDCISGKVHVSSLGLMMLKFQGEDIMSMYYQVMLEQ